MSSSSSSSIPSNASSSLQQLLPPQECDVCNNVPSANPDPMRQLTVSDDQNGLSGLLAFIPPVEQHHSASSIHKRINGGGLGHPCLILTQSPCGHQVFCAQVTSFKGEGILKKYEQRGNRHSRGQLELLDEHISLCVEGKPPGVRHNQLGELEYTGPKTPQQSYAHLDKGFWVDWRILNRWGGRKLTAESLSLATELYIAAERRRRVPGGNKSPERLSRAAHSRSPRRPTPSPPSSGTVAGSSSASSPSASSSSLSSTGENARPAPAALPVRSSQSPSWRSRDAEVARQPQPSSPSKKELMQRNWRSFNA